ncbi:MAG: hypothetical protein NTNFB02_27890 [Nitrospira sp.]
MLVDAEPAQDESNKRLIQNDRVAGLDRSVGDRLKRYGSSWIFRARLACRWCRAACGNRQTKQGEEKRVGVRFAASCRMIV